MGFAMEVPDNAELTRIIKQEVAPVPAEVAKIKSQAEQNAEAAFNFDMDSLNERKEFIKSIEEFGYDSMKKSSDKNSLLKVTVGNLAQTGTEGGVVSKGLTELRREISDLDPSVVDFTKRGFLGKVFNPVRAYFEKYEKADGVITDIVASLDKGKTTLKNDNVTLDIEEMEMRELTKKLNKEIELGSQMDEFLTQRIEEAKLRNDDPDRIRFVEEELLFPLRQRIMDMQQMVVVNNQGIIAMEVVKRNNKELIRGVDRAKTVTVSALRTAVMVAGALYNQRVTLKKIEALNETTNQIIASTSKALKEQGAAIAKQSMESSVSVDTLKVAFDDALDSLAQISAYKQEALPKMRETIAQFKELADKGEAEISKLERGAG